VHAAAFDDRERDGSSCMRVLYRYAYVRNNIINNINNIPEYNIIIIETMLTSVGLKNGIKLYSQRRRPQLFTVYEDGSINALH